MNKYTIVTKDGENLDVTREKFWETFKEGGYCLYSEGGVNILLPKCDKNIAVTEKSKKEKNSGQKDYYASRCRNPKTGTPCRNKCTRCPRNGEQTGLAGREQCCLKDDCTADCTCCPYPRDSFQPLSVELLREDSGNDIEDTAANIEQIMAIKEDAELLAALMIEVEKLAEKEQELIRALYFEDRSVQDIADARQAVDPETRNKTLVERVRRERDKILAKLKKALSKNR